MRLVFFGLVLSPRGCAAHLRDFLPRRIFFLLRRDFETPASGAASAGTAAAGTAAAAGAAGAGTVQSNSRRAEQYGGYVC